MPPEVQPYLSEWLEIANKDFHRVRRNLQSGDPEAAGFYLQQALEKFLKAFLLSKRWKLRRIHDLEALLDNAVAFDPGLEQFRFLCQEVSPYYTPGPIPNAGSRGTEHRAGGEGLGSFDSHD